MQISSPPEGKNSFILAKPEPPPKGSHQSVDTFLIETDLLPINYHEYVGTNKSHNKALQKKVGEMC